MEYQAKDARCFTTGQPRTLRAFFDPASRTTTIGSGSVSSFNEQAHVAATRLSTLLAALGEVRFRHTGPHTTPFAW